jgi:hypothetical protein
MKAPPGNIFSNSGTLKCRDNGYKERTFLANVTYGTEILYWNRPEEGIDYGGGSEVSYGDYEPEDITGGRFFIAYNTKLESK